MLAVWSGDVAWLVITKFPDKVDLFKFTYAVASTYSEELILHVL